MSLSSIQCFGSCFRIPPNPITARFRTCSRSWTPAALIWSPPTPTSVYGAPNALSSLATPAAFMSPEVSPATNRISGTRANRRPRLERGQTALDLLDDAQRDRERLASRGAGHRDRGSPLDRLDEALELQTKRVSLWRVDRDSFDELFDRLRALRVPDECGEVHVPLQPIELPGPRAEIQRQIAA